SLISDPDGTNNYPLLFRNIPFKILHKKQISRRMADTGAGRRNMQGWTVTIYPEVFVKILAI
ncbi:MAG TPA: hypothetical protein DCZ40_07190, partial [Lachnospiraceae bacterium]|nr:hypothetical protein [Lachnospiraceae bacterium]